MHKDTVTADMEGGLGNQLFSIWTCLAYARDHNRKYMFKNHTMLYHERARPTYWQTICREVLTVGHEVPVDCHYYEPCYQYKEIPAVEGAHLCLHGHFQSYRYFDHHRSQLLELFKLDRPANIPANTCSLHIRLDDYKKHPHVWPILNVNYYVQALMAIREKHDFSKVMFFTDPASLSEARELIATLKQMLPFLTFVHSEVVTGKLADYQELLAMAACDYHVMANSSFSWWGAYLAESKMVCYPKLWIHGDVDTSTACPPSWTKIDWK